MTRPYDTQTKSLAYLTILSPDHSASLATRIHKSGSARKTYEALSSYFAELAAGNVKDDIGLAFESVGNVKGTTVVTCGTGSTTGNFLQLTNDQGEGIRFAQVASGSEQAANGTFGGGLGYPSGSVATDLAAAVNSYLPAQRWGLSASTGGALANEVTIEGPGGLHDYKIVVYYQGSAAISASSLHLVGGVDATGSIAGTVYYRR